MRTKGTWALEIDGLYFAQEPGERYWYGTIKGFGKADVRGDAEEYSGAHGGFMGEQFWGFRRIPLKLGVYNPNSMRLGELVREFNEKITINRLLACRVVKPNGEQYGFSARLYGTPKEQTEFVDEVTYELDLVCEDPFFYDYAGGKDLLFELYKAANGGWLMVSGKGLKSVSPHGWLSVAGQQNAIIHNAGSVPTFPVITIRGAVTNPVVRNKTTGQTIALHITTVAGDELVIDSSPRDPTVILNGYGIEGALTSAEYFPLVPGDNELEYTSASSADTATVVGVMKYGFEGIL